MFANVHSVVGTASSIIVTPAFLYCPLNQNAVDFLADDPKNSKDLGDNTANPLITNFWVYGEHIKTETLANSFRIIQLTWQRVSLYCRYRYVSGLQWINFKLQWIRKPF